MGEGGPGVLTIRILKTYILRNSLQKKKDNQHTQHTQRLKPSTTKPPTHTHHRPPPSIPVLHHLPPLILQQQHQRHNRHIPLPFLHLQTPTMSISIPRRHSPIHILCSRERLQLYIRRHNHTTPTQLQRDRFLRRQRRRRRARGTTNQLLEFPE